MYIILYVESSVQCIFSFCGQGTLNNKDLPESKYLSVQCSQGWAYVLFKRTQCSCVLLHSFQKNEAFLRSFAFFIKRTERSLRSFTFFIKVCGVLCVLLRSLLKNLTFFVIFYILYIRAAFFAFFYILYKRMQKYAALFLVL